MLCTTTCLHHEHRCAAGVGIHVKMSKDELHKIEAKDTPYCYRGLCVCLCVCLCVSVVHNCNNSWTDQGSVCKSLRGPKQPHVLTESPDQRNVNRAVIGNELQPIVKYMEYPACGRYSQLYTVGGSCVAAIRWQYCNNLLFCATYST